MKSFFNTYTDQLPHSTSDEVQFIVSVIGVVANVAAVPDGRECVIQTVEGQQMVRQLVQNITKIPDSCICIQRYIFNVRRFTLKRHVTFSINLITASRTDVSLTWNG